MKKNIFKKQYGFSLIETLIAVSILMIAIAGPLSLVQAGLFSSIHQRNQIVATYLAQEAVEFIKNLRDTNSYTQFNPPSKNWLAGPDGVTLLTTTCSDSIGCYVDPHGKLGGAFVQIATPSSPKVLYQNNTDEGVFMYYSYDNGGTATSYKRTVKLAEVSGNTENGQVNEVAVTVIIEWMDNLVPRSYVVHENIYNYEQP
jgi:type II secretory pathway pseudopilin PulG